MRSARQRWSGPAAEADDTQLKAYAGYRQSAAGIPRGLEDRRRYFALLPLPLFPLPAPPAPPLAGGTGLPATGACVERGLVPGWAWATERWAVVLGVWPADPLAGCPVNVPFAVPGAPVTEPPVPSLPPDAPPAAKTGPANAIATDSADASMTERFTR